MPLQDTPRYGMTHAKPRRAKKYELSIARLYETFAAILPSSSHAWTAFADEECLHAKWINELHTHLDDENISFEQTKITMQSIKTAIDYIESQIEKAIGSQVDVKRVLIIAVDIEKSLSESAFLRVFKLSGPKAQKVQSRLLEATGGHVERLMEWQRNIR